jgi:hypothetical protein
MLAAVCAATHFASARGLIWQNTKSSDQEFISIYCRTLTTWKAVNRTRQHAYRRRPKHYHYYPKSFTDGNGLGEPTIILSLGTDLFTAITALPNTDVT